MLKFRFEAEGRRFPLEFGMRDDKICLRAYPGSSYLESENTEVNRVQGKMVQTLRFHSNSKRHVVDNNLIQLPHFGKLKLELMLQSPLS